MAIDGGKLDYLAMTPGRAVAIGGGRPLVIVHQVQPGRCGNKNLFVGVDTEWGRRNKKLSQRPCALARTCGEDPGQGCLVLEGLREAAHDADSGRIRPPRR